MRRIQRLYLKGIFKRNQAITFNEKLAIESNYRPFIKQFYYSESFLSDRLTQNHYDIFGGELKKDNIQITFRCVSAENIVVLQNKRWKYEFIISQPNQTNLFIL